MKEKGSTGILSQVGKVGLPPLSFDVKVYFMPITPPQSV
jgi:hypothetical protein